MSDGPLDDVIHDWNAAAPTRWRRVRLHDETLRDGLQSPSASDPDLGAKREIVRLLAAAGVDSVDLGLPGAGPRARAEIADLLAVVRDEGLGIDVGLACRTHEADVSAAVALADDSGVPIEAMLFIGTSPIRQYAEGWDEAHLEAVTRRALRQAKAGGLGVTYVTEDTVRSKPATLRRLFTAAIEEGATCLVLCDTVGHAVPDGVRALFAFTLDLLAELGVADEVSLDWHGHNDRGLAVINTLTAVEAGATRVHGTVLGIGERVGNAALDQVMLNLKLAGGDDRDLTSLDALVRTVAAATETPIPARYPAFGADAFRTGTGTHAAAIVKAHARGDAWLADRVYSAVPAQWVGRQQQILVDYMSGGHNVRAWLAQRGMPAPDAVVEAVLAHAKTRRTALTDDEILGIVAAVRAA